MKSIATLPFVLLFALAVHCLALTNPNLEAPYNTPSGPATGQVANGWSVWSSGSATYAMDTTSKLAGSASQKITLATSGITTQLYQSLNNGALPSGRSYSARIWMKADRNTTVSFLIRERTTQTAYLSNMSVGLTTNWQQVTIQGLVPGSETVNALFMIQMWLPATVWVENASFEDITPGAEILTNAGMEGTYYAHNINGISGTIAPNWIDNSDWGTAVAAYSPDSSGHTGVAQKIIFSSGGANNQSVQFVHTLNLSRSKIYNASIWLKASANTTATLAIRQTIAPYAYYVRNTDVPVTTSWTQANVSALTGDGSALFMVSLEGTRAPVTLWVDDASLTDATPPLPTSPICDEFFGMHFELGKNGLPWPSNFVGMHRLWDSGVTWNKLQPNSTNSGSDTALWDQIVLAKLTNEVDTAVANNATLIMTLGMTPDWATTYRSWVTSNPSCYGNGAPGYPSNLQYWRDYLTGLGNKYKGKIRYWEIWNEPNGTIFSAMTATQMTTLTQEAKTILKAIDPANQIISPSPAGMPSNFLDAYLAAGGGNYCDIIGYHLYVDDQTPEDLVSRLGAVRQCMAKYSVNKPVWNTEQGWYASSTTLSDVVASAYIARITLLNWAYGMEGRMAWYRWESGETQDIWLTAPNTYNNSLTIAGVAHQTVSNWLRGGVVMTTLNCDSNNTWHITITRPYSNPAYTGHIFWNPTQTISDYSVSGLGITRHRALDGTNAAFSGTTASVGAAPILLENIAP